MVAVQAGVSRRDGGPHSAAGILLLESESVHDGSPPEVLVVLSSFEDKSRPPEAGELDAGLGRSARAWKQLVAGVARRHAPIEAVWNFAGAKFGWSLRLRRNDRVLLYLIPQGGHFLVGVVLGEKAVKGARESGLPSAVLELIDAARPYAEGRGIRIPVSRAADLDVVLDLVALKLAR
jgi:hypothetical protein